MRIDFEKIERENNQAVEKKEKGIGDLVIFLNKVKPKLNWDNSQSVLESLRVIKEDEYQEMLSRVNGVVSGIPIPKREFLGESKSSKIATGELSIFNEESLVFPSDFDRKELQHYFFEKLQKMMLDEKGDETTNQRVALGIYNSIIYIHPFVDGNGRTARLSYFLLSPIIKTENKSKEENIKKVLSNRFPAINEYHRQLDLIGYALMLEKRNLPMTDLQDGVPYEYKYKIETEVQGFDGLYLRFFAAYDVMAEEEKQKYNKGTRECELRYNLADFDEDLKQRYFNKLNDIRKEFTKTIIDFSLDPEGQIKVSWLQNDYLDKSFELKS